MSAVSGLSLGMYEKALPMSVEWPERLAMAANLGLEFVEMSIDPSEARLGRLKWSPAKRREMKRIMEDTNVPILSFCLSAHRHYPLGSSDKARRNKGLSIMRDAIDLASDLGIRIIQVAGFDTYSEPSNAASRQRYLDGLHQATVWASERAVLLGIENQENFGHTYVVSPTIAVGIIQQISSPYLQLYMDIGNLIVNECDVSTEIAAAQGYLLGIHVKDARPGVNRRVPLGEGDVPFDAIFRQLAAMGFRGPVMIEMWNDDRPDALSICAGALKWVEQRLVQAFSSKHAS